MVLCPTDFSVLCGTGFFAATFTMVVLAATGFAISPLIFGAFMDCGWYGATLLGAAAVLLLSVVAALGVGQRTGEPVLKVNARV